MSYKENLEKATSLINAAVRLDKQVLSADAVDVGKWEEVVEAYTEALDWWDYIIKYEHNEAIKRQY